MGTALRQSREPSPLPEATVSWSTSDHLRHEQNPIQQGFHPYISSSFALFVSMLTHAIRLIRMSGNLSWRATQESLRAWHSTLWRVLMTYCMWMTCRSIQIIACHSPRLERLLVKALHLRSTSQLVHTRQLCPLLASHLCSSRALQGEIDHHTLRAASITFMDSV